MGWGDSLKSAWDSATGVAKAAAEKVAGGAAWVGDQVKGGVRAAERGIGDAVYSGIGKAKSAYDGTTGAIGNAYDKTREYFTGKPPAQPCLDCTGKDVDHDGALVGYKDGKCGPITNKGQKVTPADIEAAKQSGYNPRSNAAVDPEHPGDATRNTSSATAKCCEQCTKGQPKRTIFYVNGINTDKRTHCETLKQIGDTTCATVIGVYNATEDPHLGGFSPVDAVQTSQDRNLIKSAAKGKTDLAHDGRNPAVDTLSDLVVAEQSAGRPPEIWAHSQGGAVTSLALYDANNTLKAGNKGDLSGVKVNSFGSAAPQWVNGPTYNHYVNVNDATPMLFGLGDSASNHAAKAGGGNVVTFSGGPGSRFEEDPAKLDKHWKPAGTEYHGVDNVYIPMHSQRSSKTAEPCSCDKKSQ